MGKYFNITTIKIKVHIRGTGKLLKKNGVKLQQASGPHPAKLFLIMMYDDFTMKIKCSKKNKIRVCTSYSTIEKERWNDLYLAEVENV